MEVDEQKAKETETTANSGLIFVRSVFMKSKRSEQLNQLKPQVILIDFRFWQTFRDLIHNLTALSPDLLFQDNLVGLHIPGWWKDVKNLILISQTENV